MCCGAAPSSGLRLLTPRLQRSIDSWLVPRTATRRVGKVACRRSGDGTLASRDFAHAVKRQGPTAWAKAQETTAPVARPVDAPLPTLPMIVGASSRRLTRLRVAGLAGRSGGAALI